MKIYGADLTGPTILERVTTLDPFVPSADEARIVYAEDEKQIYLTIYVVSVILVL